MKFTSVATLLRERRRQLGLLQSDVARLCGVTPEAICQIEAGKRRPSLNRLPLFAAALDLDLNELLTIALMECAPALKSALEDLP